MYIDMKQIYIDMKNRQEIDIKLEIDIQGKINNQLI